MSKRCKIQDTRCRIENIGNRASCIMHHNKKGFTLIETVIVIIIIAILAVVVIMRSPFDSIKLASAAKKVAGDIRYTQKLAISTQQRCGVTFNGTGYSVQNITWSTLAKSPGDTCSSDAINNFVVDFTASRCSNYSGVTISIPPTPTEIYFNSLGTPVNQWGTMFGSNQTIRLSHSSAGTQDLTVEQGTGRVSY